jgi:hypothetical protein
VIVGRAILSHRVCGIPDSFGGHGDPNNVERDTVGFGGTPFEWVLPHTYRKTVATMLDRQGLGARNIAVPSLGRADGNNLRGRVPQKGR